MMKKALAGLGAMCVCFMIESGAVSAASSTTIVVPVPTPFTGTAVSLPGTIQAADYDNGGEGVAFHDTTPGNAGGAYRHDDVDIEPSTDGAYDVGWISPSEWLVYSVNVATAGTHLLEVRVAALGQGGTFHIEFGGSNVTGTLAIPDMGGWQTWTTLSSAVTLGAGPQFMKLVFDSIGANAVGNVEWIRVGPALPTPFTGTAVSLPGTVQAANYDNGGEGVAYHDTTPGNAGGAYRHDDVDIEPSTDGAYDVGWISPSEWLVYTVNVATAGTYLIEASVASLGQGGTFHVEFGGSNVTGALTIPDTGGWQSWTTVSRAVTLGTGPQFMKLAFDTMGSNAVGNVEWIRFSPAFPTPYTGNCLSLPGAFQAANFDNGGEGIAYHDTTPGNSGGQYRNTDVDLEDSSLGGIDVGWTADGEWLSYCVNVTTAGTHTIKVQVASPGSAGRLHARFGAADSASVAIPDTGGWQTWTVVTLSANLAAGTQFMKLMFDVGGFNVAGVTVAYVPTTFIVGAGADFQAALNAANPGDSILLQAGATFVGNFVLPAKTGDAFITVRSTATDASLPAHGVQIDPSFAPALPKLQSPNGTAPLSTAAGAHHYRLLYLEFLPNVQGAGDLLDLGDGSSAQNTLVLVPHDLAVDSVYMHGDPVNGQKRAISLNSASTTIQNSYIAGIMANGQDSQAVAGWNGPGPFTVTNNYLEAAGENIIFGGDDPAIPLLVPSDITITRNHLTKQLAWRPESQWNVKNLFELKNAQRVLVNGNLMEYNWLAAQSGYAVLFTPRNQYGGAPWAVVRDVQFTNNIVRHVGSGINILGTDYLQPSLETTNILIRNNLFEDVSAANWGGAGRFLLINGGSGITVDHNTIFQDGTSAISADTTPTAGFVLTNNILPDALWLIIGTNMAPGNSTIAYYFPNSPILHNILVGSNPAIYPSGNFFPASMDEVGFTDLAGGNFQLAPSSLYRHAGTDGTDVGCDIVALIAAIQ